jgi:PAS domain S-box-containing protein
VTPPLPWDVSDITAASEALIAADDSNRILAVSVSAAKMLGWRPDDLVGERIIAIIPERLHETHIVGFLRFLLTGRQGIIGSLVTVPARRADGTEISVGLSIRVLPRSGGRTGFVAELTAPP